MALNDTILNIGATAMQNAMTHASLHTATPNASGSNASAAARQPITWETPTTGDMVVLVDITFTGGTPGGPVVAVGFWSALSAGTWYGFEELAGDATFNAEGEYTVTGVSIPGTAT